MQARATEPTEPRFVITAQGDTYTLVAALTNGDYLVTNKQNMKFQLPAHTIKGIR